MWLLSTNKLDRLRLVEFSEELAPKYAILSHTWGKEEVTFQEIQALSGKQSSEVLPETILAIRAKKGFTKVSEAAAVASEQGYSYIWADTCCIDKKSSAELSEAINSMYRWYEQAGICYAYLEDVKPCNSALGDIYCSLRYSRWFTRGWTLQELIAPEDVRFYGSDWAFLGSKERDENVRLALEEITGIDIGVLEGVKQLSEISIGERMKWASQRKTTRTEDSAYCLMGLFDVNMPLIYGEGMKAFIRLQEEILKGSNDHSIFAWKAPEKVSHGNLTGLLAETPEHFSQVDKYQPMSPSPSQESTTWSTTNQGLRLSLFLLPCYESGGPRIQGEYYAVLECAIQNDEDAYHSPAIRLRQLYGDQFARVFSHTVRAVETPAFHSGQGQGAYKTVFVKQKPAYMPPDIMVSFKNILVDKCDAPSCYLTGVWPMKYWNENTSILRLVSPHSSRTIGLFRFFASSFSGEVDVAVGLRRLAGKNWAVRHMQRRSTGQPLRHVAASLNRYLTDLSTVRRTHDSRTTWKDNDENYGIQVQVKEVQEHGRIYYSVKAWEVARHISVRRKRVAYEEVAKEVVITQDN
ncbi:heterokaryon incompatibility protein-domain-containing protein [Xylaria arbuscula]|nr:heterokaryon incompatibility protein-domain-containing protein [Xylaria arbuscula]